MTAGLLTLAASLALVTPTATAASAIRRPMPTSSVAQPMPGERFELTGSLGRSVPRTARLQFSTGQHWVTRASARVSSNGRYRFTTTQPSARTGWRVIARTVRVGGHLYRARRSATRPLSWIVPSVRLTATRAVRAGGPVTLAATATPVRSGTMMRIDVNTGAGWKPLVRARESRRGRLQSGWTSPSGSARTEVHFRAVVASVARSSGAVSPAATSYVLPATPIAVAAHAGGSARYPTNSWPAFDEAFQRHVDWVETDFRRTAGNAELISNGPCAGPKGKRFWMVFHDGTYQNATDVASVFPGRENELTTDFTCTEAKQLTLKSPGYPNLPHRQIGTLAEFVGWIGQFEQKYGYADERLMLEYKDTEAPDPTDFADLYDEVKQLAPSWIKADSHDDKAVFSDFAYTTAFAPLLDPDWGTPAEGGTAATNDRVDDGAELSAIIDQTSDPLPLQPAGQTPSVTTRWAMVQYASPRLTTASAAAAHQRVGLVAVWTVNDTTEMLTKAVDGADIVLTNRVPEAQAALLR